MRPTIICLLLAFSAGAAGAGTATITIDAAQKGPRLNPRMYGIFLEEINHGVDGGLYGELIRNRGFEYAKPPEGFTEKNGEWVDEKGYNSGYHRENDGLPYWSLVKEGAADGSMRVVTENPLSKATAYSLRLEVTRAGGGRIGVANEGFWGISAMEGQKYQLSFYARCAGGFAGPLTASLEDAKGSACTAPVRLTGVGAGWKQLKATLTATRSVPNARFVLTAGSTGTVWLDLVSLFPAKTFKGRSNGLRPDIAQMIAGLKPGFVRFPGGCVVEGGTIETAYDWKKTVGPLPEREEIWNDWAYRRTHGMGFFEYLQFCEDIGAEPLFVGFAGQTCAYRQWEHVPLDRMQPVVDGFLDAVEYANGPVDSKWGKLRAAAGHPKPFGLKLMEIGNENMGEGYEERYPLVFDALHKKHPEIQTIACFRQSRAPTQMVDDHFYNSPRWFLDNTGLYDGRDRSLPPVYVGEIAVTSDDGGPEKGNMISALAEGAFLMGLERNADVVRMVSYAPLLAHVSGRSGWHGMIYFDSHRTCGTVSYHLWKLLGLNRPDFTVKTAVEYQQPTVPAISGSIGVGTWDTSAEFKDVRVEKDGQVLAAPDFAQGSRGWTTDGGKWSVQEGAWRQSDTAVGLSYFGDPNWSDYTLTLKARKIAGAEGFLIAFGRKGGETYWWNIGGWGNRETGIEFNRSPVGRRVPGQVETGRWYDIKVELRGSRIRCSLDGKLIHDETTPSKDRFFALAGRDEKSGDLVVKAINTSAEPVTAKLSIANAGRLAPEAACTLLSAAAPDTNNSLDNPTKVAPVQSTVKGIGPAFEHTFPAYSLTILRMRR